MSNSTFSPRLKLELLCLAMVAFWSCGLAAWTLAQPPTQVPTQPSTQVTGIWKTWGVISDAPCRDSGLPELLTAELSQRSYELVERDVSDQVIDEQLLQQLFIEQDLRSTVSDVGNRTKADALIVLQMLSSGTVGDASGVANPASSASRSIRVSVYDCQQGVRLGFLSVDASKRATATTLLADAIDGFRKRFPQGIQYAIGISPFASLNLEKRYDHLGRQFHDLLASSLSLAQGVAVIDYEQAKRIAQESTNSQAMKRRVVPQVIEADYRVTPGTSESPERIRFSTISRSDREERRLESPELPMNEAGTWIVREWLPKLLQAEDIVRSLGVTEQRDMMRERADRFSKLGDFRNAAQFLESLVLLHEGSIEDRLLLLDNYRYLSGALQPPEHSFRTSDASVINREAFEVRMAALEQLEWLIRNRHLHLELAFEHLNYWCVYHGGLIPTRIHWMQVPEYASETINLRELDARFLESISRSIRSLARAKIYSLQEELKLKLEWSKLVWSTLSCRYDDRYWTVSEMLEIMENASRAIPEDYPTIEAAIYFASAPAVEVIMRSSIARIPKEFEFRRDASELREAYRVMLGKDHFHLRAYGELGLFYSTFGGRFSTLWSSDPKVAKPTPSSLEWVPSAIEEATRVIDMISKRPESTMPDPLQRRNEFDYVLSRFVQFRNSLQAALDRTEREANMPTAKTKKLAEPALGRMQFEPLPFDFATMEEKFDLVAGNQDFDWLIGTDHIWRLERDLKINHVCDVPHARRTQTLWDGASLYLLHADDPTRPWQVRNEQGQLMDSLDPVKMLPPFEKLKVFVVAPHQLCAVGDLEKETRSWCAMIYLSPGSHQVQVFHEGRRPLVSNIREVENWDKGWVVKSSWAYRYQDKGIDYFLMNRSGLYPLRVDLHSLSVEVIGIPQVDLFCPLFTHDQFMFVYGDPWAYSSIGIENQVCPRRRLIPATDYLEDEGILSPRNYDGTIIDDGDWIYVPGYAWYRFDRTLKRSERLVPTRLPHQYGALAIRRSQVHGILGFQSKDSSSPTSQSIIYRITVSE